MTKTIQVASCWILIGLCGVTQAAVTSVTTLPDSTGVPLGRAGSMTFNWKVATDIAGSATINSSKGEFRTLSGAVLQTVKKNLTASFTGPAIEPVRETVLVPVNVAFQAHKLGFKKLVYRRTFSDGGGSQSGQITIKIVGTGGAAFSLFRMKLEFDDESPIRTVIKGESLRARANISYNGAGLFKASWEIAGPDSTAGKPVFRPVKEILQNFTSSEPVTITSPALPTDTTGSYIIRLVIEEPEPGFEIPQIRYIVNQETR